MKLKKIILFLSLLLLLLLFFMFFQKYFKINEDNFNKDEIIYNLDVNFKKSLGYCPTMKNNALKLSKENNYLLVEFESASIVLNNLKQGNIDFALIGRKAKNYEVSEGISLYVLKSGYTLITKDKSLIDLKDIHLLDVYTYLPETLVSDKFNYLSLSYFDNFNEIFNLLDLEKVILISWDDWKDDFELLVVYDGFEKVKDFRGSFLYSYN